MQKEPNKRPSITDIKSLIISSSGSPLNKHIAVQDEVNDEKTLKQVKRIISVPIGKHFRLTHIGKKYTIYGNSQAALITSFNGEKYFLNNFLEEIRFL